MSTPTPRGPSPGVNPGFALDSVAVPVLVLDREGRTTALNRSALELLGRTTREVVGADFPATLSAGNDTGGEPDSDRLRRACRDGTTLTRQDGLLRRPDGREVEVRWTLRPVLVGGLLNGATVTLEDLSALRRNDARHVRALEALRSEHTRTLMERDHLRAARMDRRARLALHGDSPPLERALERLEAAAVSSVPVMLCGAPATGRRAMAHFLHARSQRQDAPLAWGEVTVDGTLEAAGIVRQGVTDGVVLQRLTHLADGGTLAIAALERAGAPLQAALLTLLDGELAGDVRLVTVCTEALMDRVAAGGFSEPLYYRLSAMSVPVPGLAERKADLPLLIDALLEEVAAGLGLPPAALGANQRARLAGRNWPGNLAELEAELSRMLLGASEDRKVTVPNRAGQPRPGDPDRAWLTEAEMRRFERANTVEVMRAAGGKVAGAGGGAEALGIKPNTLAYRLKTMGIRSREYLPERVRRRAGEPDPMT